MNYSNDDGEQKYNSATIHEILNPVDVSPADRIRARIQNQSRPAPAESVKIHRLSPLGIELTLDSSNGTYEQGENVHLDLVFDGQRSRFQGLVVGLVFYEEDRKHLGIRFSSDSSSKENIPEERRKEERWICSRNFLPVAIASNPMIFNEFIHFTITDVSGNGLRLKTSLSNRFLIPGIRLELAASFPMIGNATIRAQIARIDIHSSAGQEDLIVGMDNVELTKVGKDVVGQYLAQFSNVSSPAALEGFGFAQKSILLGLSFSYLKTERDYREAIALRREFAHNNCESDEQISGIGDTDARILIAKLAGKAIATARIHFPDVGKSILMGSLDASSRRIPSRHEVIEIDAVHLNSAYNQRDLAIAILKFICGSCITSRRPYILISVPIEFGRIFEYIGLSLVPESNGNNFSNSRSLMLGHAVQSMSGAKTNPVVWCYVWKDVAEHLIEIGEIRLTGVDSLMLKFYQLISPLSKLIILVKHRFNKKRSSA